DCRVYACSTCLCSFNDAATTEIYTLSLHDALPISGRMGEYTIEEDPNREDGKRVLMGPFSLYNLDNFDEWAGGGEMMEDEGEGDEGAALDGDALVNERCTVCHTRDRIDAQDKDEDGWTQTVDTMISFGAQLNEEERAAVIDYLVATH